MLLEFIDRGDRSTLRIEEWCAERTIDMRADAIPTAEAQAVVLITAEDYEARVERGELG